MSSYSASPAPAAPPARIRVVSHPPLPPLRAWLPLAGKETVGDLEASLLAMLKGVQGVEFELQGFALLKESPCSMLDPANDILDIKAVEEASPTAAPLAAPTPQPTVAPAPVPAPKSNGSAALKRPLTSSSDSSSDSSDPSDSSDASSSDSDSSDSDDEPEKLSTKPPAPKTNGAPPARPTPAKRARSASSSSSSSSGSSSSGSGPLSTISFPPLTASLIPTAAALPSLFPSTTAAAPPSEDGGKPTVAPGQGLARTKSRNARKRLLKASREAEEKAREEAARAYEEGGMEVDAAPFASTSASLLPPTPTPAPSTSSNPKLALDPYASHHGPQLNMLHLASGNKNKKKTIIGLGNSGGKGSRMKLGTRINFLEEPQRVWGATSGDMEDQGARKEEQATSPRHVPDSPPSSTSLTLASTSTSAPVPAPATPISTSTSSKKKRKSLAAAAAESPGPSSAPTHALPPSKRSDLPPNVVVTSVDVEAKHWEAGVGEIVQGTSADWAGWAKEAPAPRLEVAAASEKVVEMEVEDGEEDWGAAWKGWAPGWKIEERFARGGERLSKLSREEGKEGMKVATRILALNPLTFAPELSLKYGLLLAPSPTATLRIKLHPSCLPPSPDDDEVDEVAAAAAQWDGEEDWDGGARRRGRARFGMGVEEEGNEGNEGWKMREEMTYEGEWSEVWVVE